MFTLVSNFKIQRFFDQESCGTALPNSEISLTTTRRLLYFLINECGHELNILNDIMKHAGGRKGSPSVTEQKRLLLDMINKLPEDQLSLLKIVMNNYDKSNLQSSKNYHEVVYRLTIVFEESKRLLVGEASKALKHGFKSLGTNETTDTVIHEMAESHPDIQKLGADYMKNMARIESVRNRYKVQGACAPFRSVLPDIFNDTNPTTPVVYKVIADLSQHFVFKSDRVRLYRGIEGDSQD